MVLVQPNAECQIIYTQLTTQFALVTSRKVLVTGNLGYGIGMLPFSFNVSLPFYLQYVTETLIDIDVQDGLFNYMFHECQ